MTIFLFQSGGQNLGPPPLFMYDIDPHTIKSQKNMKPTRADTILQVQRCGLYLHESTPHSATDGR